MALDINLGALTVTLGLDTKEFKESVDDAKKQVKQTSKELRKSVNEWGKWGAGIAAAAATGVAALTLSTLKATKELGILAHQSNETVKSFEQGAFAAGQFGIETEKYGDILKDVNDRVGDFLTTGGGPMLDFFEKIGPKIGVTIDDFKGLSGQQALGLYVDSLQKANVSQEEMTFFMEAIASDSTRLLPLFKDNAKALNELTKEADDLGIGLEAVDLKKLEDANKQLAKVGGIADTAGKSITVKLAPFITEISERFVDASKDAGGFGEMMDKAFGFAIKVIGVFANGLHGVRIIFKGLELAARGFIAGVSVGFEEITKTALGFGKSIAQGVINPLKKGLKFAAKFSDTAAEKLEQLNEATKDLYEEPTVGLSDFTKAQLESLDIVKAEMVDLTNQKIPSQAIDEFVADVNEKVKKAIENNPPPKIDIIPKKKKSDSDEPSEAEAIEAETVAILEALGIRGQSKDELQLEEYERELEALEEQKRKKLISEDDYQKKVAEIQRKTEELKRKSLVSNLQQGFAILASNSKKVTKFMKGMAVVNATRDGIESAVAAWKAGMQTGGPWAPVVAAGYAAASLAKTGALISSIKSGGKGSVSGGGMPSSTPPASQAQQIQSGGGQPGPDRNININIEGGGAALFSSEQVRGLINQINEATNDGVQLNFAGA